MFKTQQTSWLDLKFFRYILGWRGRRLLFRGKRRRVRAGRRRWTVYYRKRRYRVRRRGRRSRVYFLRGWRPLRRRRGIWYLKYGRVWLRVYRYGRVYRVIYRGRKWPVFGRTSKYQIRFLQRWRYVKRRGKNNYIRLGKRWISIRRRRLYYMRYGGRKLLVRRRGRRFHIRYRRKWLRSRRVRYGRRRRVRGMEIIVLLYFVHVVIYYYRDADLQSLEWNKFSFQQMNHLCATAIEKNKLNTSSPSVLDSVTISTG